MRKYLYNDIDITQLAPDLFDLQQNDLNIGQKQTQIIDWYIPASDSMKSSTPGGKNRKQQLYATNRDESTNNL